MFGRSHLQPARAVPTNPEKDESAFARGSQVAAVESPLAFVGGPREAWGHASLRSAQTPRFARPQRLASLGLADLRGGLFWSSRGIKQVA